MRCHLHTELSLLSLSIFFFVLYDLSRALLTCTIIRTDSFYIFLKTRRRRLIVTSAEDLLDSLAHICWIKLSRATQNVARRLSFSKAQWLDWYTIVWYIFPQWRGDWRRKERESVRVSRSPIDWRYPAIFQIRRIGKGRAWIYVVLAFIHRKRGCRPAIVIWCRRCEGRANLLSSVYSRKRLWQETPVAEPSILSLADFAKKDCDFTPVGLVPLSEEASLEREIIYLSIFLRVKRT